MLKLYYGNTQLIQSPGVFEELMNKMNEQRRSKVLRCKNEKDQKSSLLAGFLLRYALEQEGLNYDRLCFGITPEKKPVLLSEPKLYFSLSHSGDYAVCLISDQEIGVDIENTRRPIMADRQSLRLDHVASKSFTDGEYQQYMGLPEKEKREFFLRAWTRKESYSKAVGRGLAEGFATIDTEKKEFWSCWLAEDYYLSVYCENPKLFENDLIMKEVCDVR